MDGKNQQVSIERFDPDNEYNVIEFDCGMDEFNTFLHKNMHKEFERRVSIPYLCLLDADEPNSPPKVVGYFTLASSSFDRKHLPSSERRKVIYRSVSCILLSKIAVDKSISGQGLGKWLLGKAIKQAFLSSRDVGVYALFLQSVEGKEEFYIKAGLIRSKADPSMFIYPLKQYEKAFKKIVLSKKR